MFFKEFPKFGKNKSGSTKVQLCQKQVNYFLVKKVIQRREDFGEELRENFSRGWDDYKYGFGDPDHEFW